MHCRRKFLSPFHVNSEMFWIMAPCSVVVGWRRFGGPCRLHLHSGWSDWCLDIDSILFFWVVTPCSDMTGYQRFGGPCCLHLQGEVSGAWIQIRVLFSGFWHNVVMWYDTNVSENYAASIFRAKWLELGYRFKLRSSGLWHRVMMWQDTGVSAGQNGQSFILRNWYPTT
jgi:hypothetical protein